jgi:hypothetical protein
MSTGKGVLWDQVYRRVCASIHAEQVFCSITTEMKYLPDFAELPELKTLHKQNYETSYHKNTAAGNLLRLMKGVNLHEQEKMLILMTVECFIEATGHQAIAEQALTSISTPVEEHTRYLEAAAHWHDLRKYWLRKAQKTLRRAIPPEWWTEGEALAEPAR